nr:lysophospholipid acyltransferase family protein [Micromonospora sp. DSM 115978]
MWYWLFKYVLIGPALWLLGRPSVEGAEHLPRTGPVILASNHLSVVDSFFLVLVSRRRITFVAKREYFTGRGLRGAAKRWFFAACGQIPIDRRGAAAARDALDAATGVLAAGGVWGIYPEGTRSPDGRLYRGRTGVMRVAAATGAPIVPVVMRGTRRWRFRKIRIIVCEPFDLAEHRAQLRDSRDAVRATP